ncbi:head morphogenesis [Aeromonas phage 25]|uniref:Gp31 co-chaperonin for GroEL n=1 Tax=Aeromonas phage 25 TaxID=2911441 RepID=Q19CI3_9CAUD|nr:head morphogenesis [Aeromonas phage 25]ABF72742.1 gp31 co-chaperonin for GroEL [Aeromonas phage 25]
MLNLKRLILESKNLASAGDEILSRFWISLLEKRPSSLKFLSLLTSLQVGKDVPAHLKVGMQVLIQNGRMHNVPDPRYLSGEISAKNSRKLSASHWKDIQVVYA